MQFKNSFDFVTFESSQEILILGEKVIILHQLFDFMIKCLDYQLRYVQVPVRQK